MTRNAGCRAALRGRPRVERGGRNDARKTLNVGRKAGFFTVQSSAFILPLFSLHHPLLMDNTRLPGGI
ncbi:MAG TPA: hypothetical protein VGC89_04410 [Pyrinomonadaceae bacterium]|jgi:hypothetical protein